uniref:CD276 antigen-like n=1 Tax=Astyanax mexicanus TaxID=7994 RepID=A0A3B1JRB1_ASTMX
MRSDRYRARTCWNSVFLSGLVLSLFPGGGGSFRVTVPSAHLVAARQHSVILGCEFTPKPSHNLSNLIVTWQRQEDSRVVHSFYYLKDQLELQSSDYQNRTALFYTELMKGNASLRISDVRPSDEGRYQCMVSAPEGTDRAQLLLNYGAFYTEPRLSISFSTSEVKVQYEAEGYPQPDVRWLDTQGKNLSHNMTIKKGEGQEAGLYYLKSSYVTQTSAKNITFILKNQLMNQDIQRHVSIDCAGGSAHRTVGILAVICSLLCVFGILLIAWLYWKKK